MTSHGSLASQRRAGCQPRSKICPGIHKYELNAMIAIIFSTCCLQGHFAMSGLSNHFACVFRTICIGIEPPRGYPMQTTLALFLITRSISLSGVRVQRRHSNLHSSTSKQSQYVDKHLHAFLLPLHTTLDYHRLNLPNHHLSTFLQPF